MRTLLERILVNAPLEQGGERVVEYLQHRGSADGATTALNLQLTFDVPGLTGPITIAKDVVATFAPEALSADMVPHYRVSWAPSGGGPFPLFVGTFTVEDDERDDRFWLVLDGMYQPPLGVLGEVFDALAGRFIAGSTLRGWLGQIRDGVEAACGLPRAAQLARQPKPAVAPVQTKTFVPLHPSMLQPSRRRSFPKVPSCGGLAGAAMGD